MLASLTQHQQGGATLTPAKRLKFDSRAHESESAAPQREVIYPMMICGAVANGTMPAVWLGDRAGSAVLLAVRKSVEEEFRRVFDRLRQ